MHRRSQNRILFAGIVIEAKLEGNKVKSSSLCKRKEKIMKTRVEEHKRTLESFSQID